MISQTETAGANQYGFYAVPKALEPKKKYRDNEDDEYEDNDDDQNQNNFLTIEDRKAENEKQLQRDYYVDQAPYPEFKPKERGLDYGVQIQRGDLFDFDLQVKPLIEILIGRSVVTALNELQEQKEKQQRRQNLDKYQKKRNAELMVAQRLQAKHKRKLEESERRKLQKELYIKTQQQVGKKIISRRNAKESLLGLRDQIINQLDDLGYLRSEPVSDLKIQYQEWLYAKIVDLLNFKRAGEVAVNNTISQQENEILKEHNSHIQRQMAKRKQILDQRDRVNKENAERKQKRRIKKMRKRLNSERQGDFIKFQELMQRYEQISGILKFNERSSGFTNETASRTALYISGGLDNFLIVLLESSSKELSAQEIQSLIYKLIAESGKQFQISLLSEHFDKLQSVKKRMNEDKKQFMLDKDSEILQIAEQISLDLSLLEATNINIKSKLHSNFIRALLSIYLTVQPEQSQENTFELSDVEKKRLEYAEKVKINRQEEHLIKRLERVDRILRVHFHVLSSEQQSEQVKTEKTQQNEAEDQWFDIYDGQGWQKRKLRQKKQLNKAQQVATSYPLTGLQNSFVVDERTLYYLQAELQKLLDISGGQKMKEYSQNLSNIKSKLKKDVPVFDAELHWNA